MKKTYDVTTNFWIGELNKELKRGTSVDYDLELGKLYLEDSIFEAKNLKAAIKAEWLVPSDGEYPELDGPIGETQIEAMDRRRKARFAEQEKENRPMVIKDEQDLGVIVGVVGEENTSKFNEALGIEPQVPKKVKFETTVVEDDTLVVAKVNSKDKEVESMKIALNQNKKTKKSDPSKFVVSLDHFNGDTVKVGQYAKEGKTEVSLASSDEKVLNGWSKLHWTKKADSIKIANKKLLSEIKKIEKSAKILKRIDEKLLSF